MLYNIRALWFLELYCLISNLIHVAVVLQRSIDDWEEEFVIMFHVFQFQVFHDDGLGAVVICGDFHRATLGDIACLGLESPEVAIESNVHAWEFGQIRCEQVSKLVFTLQGFVAKITDDEETLAIG